MYVCVRESVGPICSIHIIIIGFMFPDQSKKICIVSLNMEI